MKRMAFMLVCLVLALARTGEAQVPPTPGFPPNPAALAPPTPVSHPTPVAFFRQLLAMTPGERVHALTNRPVAIRGKIMAKVKEYLALDPNERELRLQATELRWYLAPLMRLPAAQRGARLAQVPDQWRNIVQSRLSEWDILPPPLQQELLTWPNSEHSDQVDELAHAAMWVQKRKGAPGVARPLTENAEPMGQTRIEDLNVWHDVDVQM